jgi:hypothetical protein
MEGWRIEGNGDWVLVSRDRSIGASDLPAVTTSLLTLATVLRDASRVG